MTGSGAADAMAQQGELKLQNADDDDDEELRLKFWAPKPQTFIVPLK